MALDVRAAAAGVIGDVLGGQSLNKALLHRLDRVGERDRGLLQQLSFGTVRELPRLQALLKQLLDKPLKDKDRDIQGLLLCGLYQLDATRIPDHAAVAATVSATKALKKHWAKGLTNAVLRRFQREREQLAQQLDSASAASHPPWLYQRIHRQWPQFADAIIAANNQQPPMTLRVNSQHHAREAYLAELQQNDISAHATATSPVAVQLAHPLDVWELPGFADGRVSVQDEGAQLAALLLKPQAGDHILDACAAPGGKTCHILESQPALAQLIAMDSDSQRLNKVSENLNRLGLQATLLAGDAAAPPAQLAPASFDRILVDAPCSATGVIRRHPDVKILRRESDIAQLAEQQFAILQGVWPLLKEGGCLLYVTCSILDEENSQVVSRFLTSQANAQITDHTLTFGEAVTCGRQLLPAPGGTDGLFYSLVRKITS